MSPDHIKNWHMANAFYLRLRLLSQPKHVCVDNFYLLHWNLLTGEETLLKAVSDKQDCWLEVELMTFFSLPYILNDSYNLDLSLWIPFIAWNIFNYTLLVINNWIFYCLRFRQSRPIGVYDKRQFSIPGHDLEMLMTTDRLRALGVFILNWIHPIN